MITILSGTFRYLLDRMEDQKKIMSELKEDQLRKAGEGPPAKKRRMKKEKVIPTVCNCLTVVLPSTITGVYC